MSKEHTVETSAKPDALGIGEIGNPGPIKNVTGKTGDEINDEIKREAFMHQILSIVVHKGIPGENPVAVPSVNGVNQPIILGKEIQIKRKYVEALAHSHKIYYTQEVPNPMKPDVIQMLAEPTPTHSFTVTKDPSGAVGKAWLDKIMAQPQI